MSTAGQIQSLLSGKQANGGGSAAPNTNILFLGLFLIVLAFFIVLTSMASFEQAKSKDVIGRLKAEFVSRSTLDILSEQQDQDAEARGESFRALRDKTYDSIELFIPKAKKKVVEDANALQFVFSLNSIFKPNEAEIRPEKRGFFEHTVRTIKSAPDKYQYAVEALIGNGKMTSASPQQVNLAMRRAAVLARFYTEQGVNPKAISTGVNEQKAGVMTMNFYVRRKHENLSKLQGGG